MKPKKDLKMKLLQTLERVENLDINTPQNIIENNQNIEIIEIFQPENTYQIEKAPSKKKKKKKFIKENFIIEEKDENEEQEIISPLKSNQNLNQKIDDNDIISRQNILEIEENGEKMIENDSMNFFQIKEDIFKSSDFPKEKEEYITNLNNRARNLLQDKNKQKKVVFILNNNKILIRQLDVIRKEIYVKKRKLQIKIYSLTSLKNPFI